SWFFDVTAVFHGDAAKLSADAAAAHKAWRDAGGALGAQWPEGGEWGLIVDGLFGIGLTRAVCASSPSTYPAGSMPIPVSLTNRRFARTPRRHSSPSSPGCSPATAPITAVRSACTRWASTRRPAP